MVFWQRTASNGSDHFDGKKFFNPAIDTDKTLKDFLRILRGGGRTPVSPWPKQVDNPNFPPPPDSVSAGEIAVTYIGHATVLLQFLGSNVLTDPNFSERAGPFNWLGPRRVRNPGVAFENLPPIDIVLLSHNHYDHMDLPSLRRLRERWNPPIVTGLGNGAYLARKGISGSIELDWWQQCEPRPGLRITYVPAQHWSSRGLFDRRRMLWGGHMVGSEAGRVYFAGDTGYPGHFGEIRKRFGPPDVALLPIGAYEPRWFMAAQHINPEEAVRAHRELEARFSVAIHFGTFRLSEEAIDEPVAALQAALQEHGVSAAAFRVPGFGETLYRRDRIRETESAE
jgi:L-ascorbate metabolism protein UlaG (beta-lactamase superfamily)